MTIMRNGASGEIIEALSYAPSYAGGVDLETSPTKTISNTSENAVADYTTVHTIAAPTDSRIAVLRGCMRLSIVVDSVGGGCTTLNYRVKRGGASVATGSFAVAAAPVTCLISWDITTLITGAQTNTLFLWVDVGTCVISEVTLWTGVGSMQSGALVNPCLSVTHIGWAQFSGHTAIQGAGNMDLILANVAASPVNHNYLARSMASTGITFADNSSWRAPTLIVNVWLFLGNPVTVTSLPYLNRFAVALRSESGW